jgi:hypothetical protein
MTATKTRARKPYRAPRLTVLGGVSRLTQNRINGMGKADNPVDKNQREMS